MAHETELQPLYLIRFYKIVDIKQKYCYYYPIDEIKEKARTNIMFTNTAIQS